MVFSNSFYTSDDRDEQYLKICLQKAIIPRANSIELSREVSGLSMPKCCVAHGNIYAIIQN